MTTVRTALTRAFGLDDVRIDDRVSLPAGRWRVDRYVLEHRRNLGGWSGPLERDVVERGHAAGLLPYDPDSDAIVLVEQFRIGALTAGRAPWMVEIVAGVIESEEAPEAVARREAMEEAGCQVRETVPIATYLPSPGLSSETLHLFCGRVDATRAPASAGLLEEGEDTRVLTLSWSQARRALDAGRFENAATLIALHWLARHRHRLRRLWQAT